MNGKCLPHNPDLGLLLLRIPLALTFLFHGGMKLASMAQTVTFFGTLGLPSFMAWFVAILEVVAGVCILSGIFARKAGWLLAVNMLFAIILVKGAVGYVGGFEYDLLLMGASLAVALAGPGAYVLFGCSPSTCCGGRKNEEARAHDHGHDHGHEGHQH